MRLTSLKKQTVTEEVIEAIICDRCKKPIAHRTEDGKWDNVIAIQEMHLFHFQGGYCSVFGDGAVIKGDICQQCFNEVLGEFLQISYE